MAKVLVQTFGGVVKTMEAENPAGLAESLGVALDNTTIQVNAKAGEATTCLRDDDFVAFVTDKVTSGLNAIKGFFA
jgi:hypothetical protein|tara:strand:+ start:5056 stop:5283 length:228 start_codon:yes stop_codon:yes gene_type:complete